VECRAERRKGGKLGGYAALFGPTADLGHNGNERLAASAFDAALKHSDVRALWEHDPRWLLGRESAGTLRLSVDSTGLEWEAEPADTSYSRDLLTLVDRGDITGASFAFLPGQSEWDSSAQTRTHVSVSRLLDVSAVAFPAYAEATTEARSELRPANGRAQLLRARARVRLEGVRAS